MKSKMCDYAKLAREVVEELEIHLAGSRTLDIGVGSQMIQQNGWDTTCPVQVKINKARQHASR